MHSCSNDETIAPVPIGAKRSSFDGTKGVRRAAGVAVLATAGVVAGGLVAGTPASAATAGASTSVLAAAPRTAARAAVAQVLAVRLPTTARLWTRSTTVRSGQTVRITGTVTYGSASKRISGTYVWLQVKAGSTWRTIARQKLRGSGWTVFTVPAATRTYRLYHPGTLPSAGRAAFHRSASAPLAIRATPRPARTASTQTASTTGARIVAAATRQAGKPYAFGAAGPNAFDCSGLVVYVFQQFGRSLPHNADAQQGYGRTVSAAAARPGDLVFIRDSSGHAYHVGIYAGGGYMIDAPRSGSTVGKHRIWSSFVVYRRLIG